MVEFAGVLGWIFAIAGWGLAVYLWQRGDRGADRATAAIAKQHAADAQADAEAGAAQAQAEAQATADAAIKAAAEAAAEHDDLELVVRRLNEKHGGSPGGPGDGAAEG